MPAYAYTMTIDRNPQKVRAESVTVDLDCLSIQEAIQKLEELEGPVDAIENIIETSAYDDYFFIEVTWYRLETPEEVQARVARAEQYNQTVRNRRRQEYEQMKQEFEAE